jgi:sec-independent protein translocase protein TatA
MLASERTEEGCKSAVTALAALYDAGMPNIGPLELVIVLVIVLVIFGPKRLPGLGRSLGSGMREFKDSVTGKTKDDEVEQLEADASRTHGEAEARQP